MAIVYSGKIPQVKVAQCRSCSRLIVWVKTASGKMMPVDFVEDPKIRYSDGEFVPGVMTSHFATCPQANRWRKAKRGNNV